MLLTDNRRSPQFLKLHGIEAVYLNGSMSASKRTEVISEFRNSGRDGARVMVMSGVGMVGLNLPVANILIVVVSCVVLANLTRSGTRLTFGRTPYGLPWKTTSSSGEFGGTLSQNPSTSIG